MTAGWRIAERRFGQDGALIFDGEGARLFGGRWNRAGVRVAYAASSLALAALEYFVHLPLDDARSDLVSVRVELPESIWVERIEADQLSADWRSYPAPLALADIGGKWLSAASSVCLLVPSAIIPQETNLLINPLHPDFDSLHFHPPVDFQFDQRMWK